MNAQFNIPTSFEQKGDENRSILSEQQAEIISKPFEKFKNIESHIESMRANATEANLPRLVKIKMRVMELFTSKPRSLEERLIEEESAIGGRIFAKDSSTFEQRFWFQSGDWFYERIRQAEKSEVREVIHYRLTDSSVHKMIDGREFFINPSEVSTLLLAIEAYDGAVEKELYGQASEPRDSFELAA